MSDPRWRGPYWCGECGSDWPECRCGAAHEHADWDLDLTLQLPNATMQWLRTEYDKAQQQCDSFTCLADFVSALVIVFHRTHLAATVPGGDTSSSRATCPDNGPQSH